MNRDIDTLVGGLAPVTDRQAGEVLSEEAAALLADRITAADPGEPRRRRSPILAIGLPLAAAGLACTAVTVAVLTQDDAPRPAPETTHARSSPNVSLAAATLSFTRKDDHIDVRVRDPLADPERYRKELAAHGLDVKLKLVPASPSMVGAVVAMSLSEDTPKDDITTITAKGECETGGGGGDRCPVGIRVRTDFEGKATIVFGRAARPGEKYNSSGQVTAPGEAMHGMTFRNHRVEDVLAELKKRNVTVPEYRAMDANVSRPLRPGQVPPTWYVHSGIPWAKNQVLLFVGPKPAR